MRPNLRSTGPLAGGEIDTVITTDASPLAGYTKADATFTIIDNSFIFGGLLGPLAELVTTGTITTAQPVYAGEAWQTEVQGIALPNVSVEFTQ